MRPTRPCRMRHGLPTDDRCYHRPLPVSLPAPTYDLVMLLDPRTEEDVRAKILTDTRQTIGDRGEVVRDDDWGDRALSYPIDRHKDAEYHLLQFKAGTPELLSELNRTLRITDGVLRFRIVKLEPGTPEAPADMRPSAAARPTEQAPDAPARPTEQAPDAPARPTEQAPDAPAGPPASAPAEPVQQAEPAAVEPTVAEPA